MDFGLVTVATAPQVSLAQATIDSARRAGFDGRLHTFVVDPTGDMPPLADGWTTAFDALPDPSLGHRLAALGLDALARAALPGALLAALHDEPAIVYLAPGVHVLGSLDDLAAAAAEGLALIARPTSSPPDDGSHPNEVDLAAARRFSGAVVGASAASAPALEWWRATAWAALVNRNDLDTEALLDRVAHRFGATTPPNPERFADWYSLGVDKPHDDGRTVRVHAHELVTVDLTAHDDAQPHRIDSSQPLPHRVALSDLPSLAAAVAARRADRATDSGPALAEGLSFDRVMRAAYEAALRDTIERATPPPPDPYDDPARFLTWLRASPFPTNVLVSRYLRQVYLSRPDLSRAFPEVPGRDTERFFAWAHDHGRTEIPIPDLFLPPKLGDRPVRASIRPRSPSVNLAGFLDAALGIGEVARRLSRAFDAAGIEYSKVGFATDDHASPPQVGPTATPHDINVVCVNPDSLASFATRVGSSFFTDRYTIGVWFWETAELPPSMAWAFDLVDEVWAASNFVADAIRARAPSRVPVHVITIPLTAPAVASEFGLADVGLVDGVPTFVTAWDYASVVDRKNPLGAIAAYTAAFGADDGAQLLLKSTNAQRHPDDHQRVRLGTRGRPDIHLVTDRLPAEHFAALLAAATAVVSLHRSEGLALNLADAVALGVPTIATAYGGNLTFMDADDTDLIAYHLVDVGPGHHPYPSDAQWAEPDVDQAAECLRALVRDPARARRRANQAQRRISTDFGLDAAARSVMQRLTAITADEPPSTRRRSLLRRNASRDH